MNLNPQILAIRTHIDTIDDQINILLAKRAECIIAMRRAKGDTVPIVIPEREKAIVDRMVSQHTGALSDEEVRHIFAEIITSCRKLEEKVEV